ncbi:MAG: hypothetical protein QOH56_1681 [Pseudonocardiales bacterium]|jgi:hypothetical protein|nr:hypothetical protein [Pseudonocardiales bacterium]
MVEPSWAQRRASSAPSRVPDTPLLHIRRDRNIGWLEPVIEVINSPFPAPWRPGALVHISAR